MATTSLEVMGSVHSDGTLELDQKLTVPPGRVQVRVESVEPPAQRPQRRAQRQPKKVPPHQAPANRPAMRACWKKAQAAADNMLNSATRQDPMQLVIAADELDIALAGLWQLRDSRDINWQTILNHVQGMLKQTFAAKGVEQLTPEQCEKIQTIVERHLGTSTKSLEDLKEVVGLIEDAGFDPYGAISPDPVEE